MDRCIDRREMLRLASGALAGGALAAGRQLYGAEAERKGCVVGQPEGARVGAEVLAAGGNAVDAIVAAALTAGVVAVRSCGIGGYGGHMVIAPAGGKKIMAIDFNTVAPQTARADMFPLDGKGAVKGKVNVHGWLAAGVPGTLAGLQLALERYGSQRFDKLVQPAIRFAREGVKVDKGFSASLRAAREVLQSDPATARLLFDQGEPLTPDSTYRNPDLANMLESLAAKNSVEAFYRGEIGRRIAAAFEKHGGLVTAKDMASYQAREVEPLRLDWRGYTLYTAPLTAGGASVLEGLAILKALGWEARPAQDLKTLRARLETLRLVWDDRLKLLGDPEQSAVPLARLMSEAYAKEQAARVDKALRDESIVPAETDGQGGAGTIHLSAADAQGTLVSLTLTHGGAYGACVTVDGLGLILGHGMARFDPRPGRPNSPGPGKRPLHNMCPTIVLRQGKPYLAIGGTGGRRIPNAVFEVLAHAVGRDSSLAEAVAAPRLHTEGGMAVTLEARAPKESLEYLKKFGYQATAGPSATIQAVGFDADSGLWKAASR